MADDEPGAEGGRPASTWWVVVLALYFAAVSVAAVWALLYRTSFHGGAATADTDLPLLHIVVAMGAIGSCVHAVTSLCGFVGNQRMISSWVLWYFFRPVVGVLLALLAYFLLRLGFVSPQLAADSNVINPYGVAALSGLVGLFSKQAVDKLREVFDTLFKSRADDERGHKMDGKPAGPASPPRITSIEPKAVSRGDSSRSITVKGENFGVSPVARIDGKDRKTTPVDDQGLRFQLEPEDVKDVRQRKITVVAEQGKGRQSDAETLQVL